MPKSYFKIDKISQLASLKSGATVHIIGVAGVAMAQLAILLSEQGYNVSGSDKEFYPPMGDLLKKSKVKLLHGYDANNIPTDVDLVVIGNAVSYGHPEVDVVEARGIPYTCFPPLLADTVISSHHSIVVAGTHGKSTTTAMIASVLNKMGGDPSYFIGGMVQDLPSSLHKGSGKFCVVEGDEYDTAFFAKVPKFYFYKPDTAIINAIEFDHGDIYPDIDAIKREFDYLANMIPDSGLLIVCSDFKATQELLPKWKTELKCKVVTFGRDKSSDFRIVDLKQVGAGQEVVVVNGDKEFTYKIPLIGEYNARNSLAAFVALSLQGLEEGEILKALATFQPVKRRQEILLASDKVILIEDFAHHPTAVRETLRGVRAAYPDATVWALFEPRSNTSRRKIFENDYIEALSGADRVLISEVQENTAVDSGVELMNVKNICLALQSRGITAEAYDSVNAIKETVLSGISKTDLDKKDIVVIMSNGSFGGLAQDLVVAWHPER